ncbi:hypothetical protein V5F32_00965 [Xanthobacter oligotrophicus]|uniref:Uncharacterized protein n=1 Tax=Xanthobacter oligotrophicus TaxID=2607286 RepID=A0ABW6ZSJ5_9HYPH
MMGRLLPFLPTRRRLKAAAAGAPAALPLPSGDVAGAEASPSARAPAGGDVLPRALPRDLPTAQVIPLPLRPDLVDAAGALAIAGAALALAAALFPARLSLAAAGAAFDQW